MSGQMSLGDECRVLAAEREQQADGLNADFAAAEVAISRAGCRPCRVGLSRRVFLAWRGRLVIEYDYDRSWAPICNASLTHRMAAARRLSDLYAKGRVEIIKRRS